MTDQDTPTAAPILPRRFFSEKLPGKNRPMTTYVLTHNGAEHFRGTMRECITYLRSMHPTSTGWSIDHDPAVQGRCPVAYHGQELTTASPASQLFAAVTAPRCSLLERIERLDAAPPDVRAEVERMLTARELAQVTADARIPVDFDERAADVRAEDNHELEE